MKACRIITFVLLLTTGIGALAGGFGLWMEPSGSALSMPLDLLDGTIFSNYLIPGLLLFLVIGGGHIVGCILMMTKRNESWSWLFPFFCGGSLIVWIVVQLAMIGYSSFLQPLYLTIGIVECVLSLILRKMQQTSVQAPHQHKLSS